MVFLWLFKEVRIKKFEKIAIEIQKDGIIFLDV